MDCIIFAVVSLFVGFVFGVFFSKHVVSEAESLKHHVTEEIGATEARLRAEIADLRSKIKL